MQAQPVVEPGGVIFLTTADGGEKDCRYYSAGLDVPVWDPLDVLCSLPPWTQQVPPYILTWYDASLKLAAAAYSNAYIPDLSNIASSAHYASGAVYSDFSIDPGDGGESLVDAQISILYDLHGGLLGALSYDAEMSLTLSVQDITIPLEPAAVGSLELFKKDRSGDQGLTDVAGGATQVSLKGETARFLVKLRRGHTYRIWFTAGAFTTTPLISGADVGISAAWKELSVNLAGDDNIAGLLAQHDLEMKNELASHDLNIEGDLMAHDLTVKADIESHDANLVAHDTNLVAHDAAMRASIGQVQFDLEHKVELRRIHLEVQEIKNKRSYLVAATVGGRPAEVELMSAESYDSKTRTFLDIGSKTSIVPVETGIYLVDFEKPKPDRLFKLEFVKPGVVDLYGQVMFDHKDDVSDSD